MARSTEVLGSIVSLRRYPVKSMMGEELNAAEVTARGCVGDRAYAVVEPSTERLASAKMPRKWGKLFDFRAAFVEPPRAGEETPPVRITFPDGTMMTSDQPEVHRALSAALGREVVLTSSPPAGLKIEYVPPTADPADDNVPTGEYSLRHQSFFDAAPIHLLTTSSLDRLRELYPQGRFDVRRFRPNIVVRTQAAAPGFVEETWLDRILAIGDNLRLRIRIPSIRCVMPTLPQDDLPGDPGILKTIVEHNRTNVGVFATVAREGTVRRGDPIRPIDDD
jgi:hypothetical protein